jgi:hypothetical protein
VLRIGTPKITELLFKTITPDFRALAKRPSCLNRKGMGMGMLVKALDEMNLY